MRRIALVLAAFAMLAACSDDEPVIEGDLDASAQSACDELAEYSADDFPEEGREETLASIAEAAQESELELIVTNGGFVENTLGENWSAQEMALDGLAFQCTENGWDGANF